MLTIRFAELSDVLLLKTMIHEFAEFEHLSVSITEETLIDFYRKLGAKFWNELKTICLRGSALQAIASDMR